MAGKDPYKFYRIEARELLDGLAQGVLALEKGAADAEQVGQLLRLAHTLKGAARVVKQTASAEAAHQLEDLLAPHRADGSVPRDATQLLLRLLDTIRAQLDALAQPAAAAAPATGEGAVASPAAASERVTDTATPARGGTERFETVRVEIAEMDQLLQSVSEVGVQLSGLRQEASEFAHGSLLAAAVAEQLAPRSGRREGIGAAALARARSLLEELRGILERAGQGLGAGLDRSDAELRQVQDRANTLRLLPASAIFGTLERAARDAARASNKDILFETAGGDHRLDGHVLGPLSEALLHVVRNAADHGIESAEARRAAGKPVRGRITLSVERRGARLLFACRDDGRGLDVDAIRSAAVRAGRIAEREAQALDVGGAVRLLLGGGLSTSERITEISGRGVGLDVVRDTVARLKGSVDVDSVPGRGVTVRIGVPLSLSSLPTLLVEAGGVSSCVPLESVRRTLRLEQDDIAHSPEGDSIVYGGRVVPFLPLDQVWAAEAAPAAAPVRTVVVVEAHTGWAALGVERLVGRADVVLRPLPPQLAGVPVVMGAAFDADGDPLPVLDVDGLVGAAHSGRLRSIPAAPRARPVVLVIDDSLTTRMLEQSILEAEGYEVALAASGEEGLRMARDRRYNLFLVDIEMPGMNGFEFIERIRADAALREIPAIVVSSLSSAEHRKRGEAAGANAYIVKGEFEQARFLDTVRELAGWAA